jgi:hypothetical protein
VGCSVRSVTAGLDPAPAALLDGEIVTARRLKDWPKLEEAAIEKVAEIENFVDNWNRVVVPINQSRPTAGAISGTKPADEAEAEWDISHQTVSRWRDALRDGDGFRRSSCSTVSPVLPPVGRSLNWRVLSRRSGTGGTPPPAMNPLLPIGDLLALIDRAAPCVGAV